MWYKNSMINPDIFKKLHINDRNNANELHDFDRKKPVKLHKYDTNNLAIF